ncbi:MAG: hypothetical protein P8Y53_22120, partial [Pseudolabrys sp.]
MTQVSPTGPTPSRTDVIPAGTAGTLDGLFRERVRRSTESVAYRHFDRTAQAWEDVTWGALAERV